MDSRGTPTDSKGTPTMCMVCTQLRVYLAPFIIPLVRSNRSIFVDSRGGPHGLQKYPYHVYGEYLASRGTQLHISCNSNSNSVRSVSGVRSKSEVCKYPCPKFRSSWMPVFLVTVGIIISPVSQSQVRCISSQMSDQYTVSYQVFSIRCLLCIQYPVSVFSNQYKSSTTPIHIQAEYSSTEAGSAYSI